MIFIWSIYGAFLLKTDCKTQSQTSVSCMTDYLELDEYNYLNTPGLSERKKFWETPMNSTTSDTQDILTYLSIQNVKGRYVYFHIGAAYVGQLSRSSLLDMAETEFSSIQSSVFLYVIVSFDG